jgi:DNA-binding FadR family transcriptional regulator
MDRQDLYIDLKATDNGSLADRAEMKLIEIFMSQQLKPGDIIPKEEELAIMMGVSRTVIRDALTRLKTIGLLESRKRKGTFVRSPDLISILSKSLIPEILDQDTLFDLFELRLALEVGMSDFIFNRKSEAAILELEEIVENEPEHFKSMIFNVDQELLFHGKLYEMSGNRTLIMFQKHMLPAFQYVYNSRFTKANKKRIKYKTHKELVGLLRNGTQEEFREGMRKHLEDHFSRIFNKDYT